MPTRALLLALTLILCTASIALADPKITTANLTYALDVGWSFDDGSVSGRILIDRPTSRKLAKLNTFSVHFCSITFDPESKIVATNGTFYTVLRITNCN